MRKINPAIIAVAAILVLTAIGLTVSGPAAAPATTSPAAPVSQPAPPTFDQYGGYVPLPVTNRSGFFRTVQVGGRWWLATPDGHAFFSLGINAVNAIGGLDQPDGYAGYFNKQYASLGEWQQLTARRLLNWNFNTLGAWADPALTGRGLAETRILGLSDGADVPQVNPHFPDVFDPAYAAAVDKAARAAISPSDINNRWLIGYFSDNELWWYKDGFYVDQPNNSVVENYIQQAANKPGKLAWVASLEAKYPTVAELNRTWGTEYASFRDGANSVLAATSITVPAATDDKLAFLRQVSDRYFEITSSAIKERDPNHLILGSRFLPPPIFRAVVEGATPYIDVFSVNMYNRNFANPALELADTVGQWSGKPVIVSEFTARAQDSGMPNGFRAPGPVTPSQPARADAYRVFLYTLASRPFVVGLHWFPYVDDSAHTGNSNNWGLVTVHDQPYSDLLSRMSATNRDLYSTRLAQTNEQPPVPAYPDYAGAVFDLKPTFRWIKAGGGSFTLQVARTPDFGNARSYAVSGSSFAVPDALDYGRWYWRIRTVGSQLGSLAYTAPQPFYVHRVVDEQPISSFESDAELAWQPEPAASFSLRRTTDGATAGRNAGEFTYNGTVGAFPGAYSWSFARRQPEGAGFRPRDWSRFDFYAYDATNPDATLPDPLVQTRITGDNDAAGFYEYSTVLRPGFNQVAAPLRDAPARIDLAAVGHLRQGLLRPRPGQRIILDNIRLVAVDQRVPAQPTIPAVASDAVLSGTVELDWQSYRPATSTVGYRVYVSTADFSSAAGITPVVVLDAAVQHTRVKLARLGGGTAMLRNGTRYYFAVAPIDVWGNEGALGPTTIAVPTANDRLGLLTRQPPS